MKNRPSALLCLYLDSLQKKLKVDRHKFNREAVLWSFLDTEFDEIILDLEWYFGVPKIFTGRT